MTDGNAKTTLREKLRRLREKYLNRAYLGSLCRGIARVLLNPRLLLCLGIAWMITNGWSYIFFGLGTAFGIHWMRIAGATWMALLWLPFTPEKILTVLIAIFLMRCLFPDDEKTLGWLREKRDALRTKARAKREEKQKKRERGGDGT